MVIADNYIKIINNLQITLSMYLTDSDIYIDYPAAITSRVICAAYVLFD